MTQQFHAQMSTHMLAIQGVIGQNVCTFQMAQKNTHLMYKIEIKKRLYRMNKSMWQNVKHW